jgi:diguanylate cyclase (GGDEF)-like protein
VAAVESEASQAAGRHFAGTNTQFIMKYLRTRTPPGTVERVLRRAGEPRSADLLADAATWSSYTEFRNLLAACAAEVGEEGLAAIGLDAFADVSAPDATAMLQALGSPSALYADIGPAAASLAPVVALSAEEQSSNEWLIRQHFKYGLEPFRQWCQYSIGVLGVTPRLFGYPPALVVEEECQCAGAPECRFRVTWQPTDEPTRRADQLEVQVQVLQASLEALQVTVGDLVSGEDLDNVLGRIITSAARAVRAPGFVLAIETGFTTSQRVYSDGFGADEARCIAEDLLLGRRQTDPHCLVVDLVSPRCTYGRLAALNPGGEFYPQELAVLQAYARLAAAALDAAAAHAETRSQATRAEALLTLASALAEIVSTEDMAQRIAAAVPSVIDCDRAIVILAETASVGRIAGVSGYPNEIAATLKGRRCPVEGDVQLDVTIELHRPAPVGDRGAGQEFMDWTGTVAAATFPIMSGDQNLGFITVSVTNRPERLTGSADLEARLRGLAGQAFTALNNAALLDQVRRQALHDALTGLPNRALIFDRAEQMLARAHRDKRATAVFFIDLDNFKSVNDTLGHGAGDQLLRAVANRLSATIRADDTVGRLGGDEFVVLAEGTSLDAGPELVAARLLDVLSEPFELAGLGAMPLTMSASIGIATGERSSPDDLLRDADIALYRAKAAGKARAVVFQPYMQSELLDRLELELDLRATLCEQFFVTYQPIFDLANMEATGVETLLRWHHPRRGIVLPDSFVPILEETGMIFETGRWVLGEACRQAATWSRSGRPLNVAVNVSMRQLEDDVLVHDVRDALDASGLDPSALVLEVTETALMRDVDATVDRLTRLKALGVRIAVDDFGTGYSSLAYLKRFPVDILKIDRSFIAGIGESPEALAMVRALIQLGRALGLETLAEGIEDARQLERLRAEGCESGQGFLFAKPMDAAGIGSLLHRPDQLLVAGRSSTSSAIPSDGNSPAEEHAHV